MEPDTRTSPTQFRPSAGGERTRTSSSIWDAASRGGNIDGEEAAEEDTVFLSISALALEMNPLILLSLVATLAAAKSPRMKFVVHGRRASKPTFLTLMCLKGFGCAG